MVDWYCAAVMAICVIGTVLAQSPGGRASSRSHRVLGRTMSSRRSPPRGNSGGFAFDMVADPSPMLAPVLDEDLVGVEAGGEHAGDVHTRHVRFHCLARVPRGAASPIGRRGAG